MELDAGTTTLLIVVAFGLGCWLLGWLWPRAEERRVATQRTRFTQQVGGVEHTGDGPTRPTFGHFHPPDSYTPPFHWAIEWNHRGFHTLVYETRTVKIKNASGSSTSKVKKVTHHSAVQMPAPPTPWLRIQPRTRYTDVFVDAADTVQGTAADHHDLIVECRDPEFARTFVSQQLVATIMSPRYAKPFRPTVTFEHGVVQADQRGPGRLHPEGTIAAADLLADVLQTIPRTVWNRPDASWNRTDASHETGPSGMSSKDGGTP